MDENPYEDCPRGCGIQSITGAGSSPGYTSALIIWIDLACGHQIVDASADNLNAAR